MLTRFLRRKVASSDLIKMARFVARGGMFLGKSRKINRLNQFCAPRVLFRLMILVCDRERERRNTFVEVGENAVDHSSFIYGQPARECVTLITGDLPGHPIADELRQLIR